MVHPANKPLLILSIFAPSEHNGLWYDLQRRFISDTTLVDYDYRIYLNGVSSEGFEPDDVLKHSETNDGHKTALNYLLSYARQHHFYDNYLFLDSDCFPVGKNWHAGLTGQMKRFNKTIAAPVRTENLDLFPHPCAVFIAGEEIHNERIDFRDDMPIKNMLGIEVTDVGSAMYGMDEVMPLLRTNVVNLDPVAAAIYHHIFYHHGAGSRAFNFRITNRYQYYDHWWRKDDKERLAKYLLRNLEKNPDKLFNILMGNRANLLQRALRRLLSPFSFF
ncbi:MAG: hypothetical protein SCH71_10200 [Desulfobulbaceae bacterium]|nr:hypothetical protein [Desulfobulbaceae bacterium]